MAHLTLLSHFRQKNDFLALNGQSTFWLHSDCMLTTFWLHSDYLLTTFRLHSAYILTISDYFWLTDWLTLFWLHSGFTLATIWLYAGHILAKIWPLGLLLREGDIFGENIFPNHYQTCKCSWPQAWMKGWYHKAMTKIRKIFVNQNYDCKCGGKRIIKVMTKINGPCSPTSFSRRAKHR